MRSEYEVADVLRQSWNDVVSWGLNGWQLRTLRAIKECRTLALGGHIDGCDSCGHIQVSYNSCRNRHCPKCQGHKRVEWIEARESELLPVPYFHVVFTLPDALNGLAIHKPKIIYDALFKAAWETIVAFTGQNNKAGMISILHTWGQNLSLHPHIHCIIPGGFVNQNEVWKLSKSKGKFLFPVKAMSKVYRAKYVAILRASDLVIEQEIFDALFRKDWVVYAKRPFGSPASVVEYLGRYTHKIAISNHRILAIDDQTVTISYKDYKDEGQKKTLTLTHGEFVRRFALHILPKRFVRIRHYGFLSSTWKRSKLPDLQDKLNNKTRSCLPEKTKKTLHKTCPCCGTGQMFTILTFDGRGPPDQFVKSEPHHHNSCVA
ncbi:MAG: IS91 family transposase [Burkholderiaceae bacterium]|nr:IS91 family transposase [Burkholderiaceae bacterium]